MTGGLGKRHRLILRWGVPSLLLATALGVLAVLGGTRRDPSAPRPDGGIEGLTSVLERDVPEEMLRLAFEDVTEQAGVAFRHFPSTRGSLLPEDMGPGLCWGDVDDDGDHDLFLVNFKGALLDGEGSGDPARCALYANDGTGRFTDVSESSGTDLELYGLGAAFGDREGDGDLDLYVTAFGRNVLLENDGTGVFADVTDESGVGDDRFGTGCAWADYDNDGDLDLYVTNYVSFQIREKDRDQATRQFGTEIPYTINPSSYPPEANVLYRNDGRGSFEDVAVAAGVANHSGRSLGAVWFDFDRDGWLDLYVANDVSANGVFRNLGDGTFADVGARTLAADYRGAMGLAVSDFGRDGDLDLFVTHWVAQENAFFENVVASPDDDEGTSQEFIFMDVADRVGLGQISLRTVGWSAGFCDFDDDGAADLWVVNGSTLELPSDRTLLVPQRPHLFVQDPDEGFYEVGRSACPRLGEAMVGRGGAACDFDGDGRMDLAIALHGGRPLLLRNVTRTENRWLGLRLRQRGANVRAIGALVTVRAGDLVQTAQVGADGAYLSQHPTDLHFGLGTADSADHVQIRWPDGSVETKRDVPSQRVHVFTHDASY